MTANKFYCDCVIIMWSWQLYFHLVICITYICFFSACSYVADKIRRLCSGKSSDGETKKVKGITERQCVLSNGVPPKGDYNIMHPYKLLLWEQKFMAQLFKANDVVS